MSQTQQYDPTRIYRKGENVPRHGARSKNGKKRRRTLADQLNAQRVGTVAGVHKASVESGRRKKKVG
jgi:hypothetical protein